MKYLHVKMIPQQVPHENKGGHSDLKLEAMILCLGIWMRRVFSETPYADITERIFEKVSRHSRKIPPNQPLNGNELVQLIRVGNFIPL